MRIWRNNLRISKKRWKKKRRKKKKERKKFKERVKENLGNIYDRIY